MLFRSDFEDAYEKVTANGDTAVVITLSGKLSGTYQSAMIAAEDYEGKVVVVDSENADDETVAQALSDISKLAMTMEMEANIETLVMAKGFEQCVAVINGDSARIIVSGSQLTQAQIAQINEVVYEQANILPVNITITEKAN